MSKLVSRLISSKMPPGFNQAAIREYLSLHWGLSAGRQSAVICLAVAGEPTSRLADVASAKGFIDSVTIRYTKYAGIAIFPNKQAGGAIASQFTSTVANFTSVETTNKQEREYLMKQFEVLAKYLDQDLLLKSEGVTELEAQKGASEERLGLMKEELEDEFTSGIESRFDSAKARTYDSCWNWVREDLISLLLEQDQRKILPKTIETDEFMQHVVGRWDSTCGNLVKYFNLRPNTTNQSLHKAIEDILLPSAI